MHDIHLYTQMLTYMYMYLAREFKVPPITTSSSLLDEEDVDVLKLIPGWQSSSPDRTGWVGGGRESTAVGYLCMDVRVEEQGVGQ